MRKWIVVAVVALALAGCGGSGETTVSPEDEARAVAEDFTVAAGSKDYAGMCDLFTQDYRESFTTDLGGGDPIVCEDYGGRGALGSPAFQGLEVTGVTVDGDEATATFSPGGSVEMQDEDGEWRISEMQF